MPPDAPLDAVICDVDGCLSPEHGDRPLDAQALALVAEHNRAARRLGDRPRVTLCTGRPQPFAEAMSRLIDNADLPVIAEMGVWLWHPASNDYELDPAITPDHLQAVREAARWVELELWPMGVRTQPGKSASISLFHPDTAWLKGRVEPMVREAFEARRWPLRVSSTWLWINCDLAHVSKASGIRRLLAHTGLSPGRLAGIGDTLGDMDIRRAVAWFGCPANADDRLKPHADAIAARPEAHGVLELLALLHTPTHTPDPAAPIVHRR